MLTRTVRTVADSIRRTPCRGRSSVAKEITFEDHVEAFRHKSTWEVVRALSILRLCTLRGVSDTSLWLMEGCQRLGVERLLRAVLKPTFYEQFVGGETNCELRDCMRRVGASGMRSMLAATMEEDVGHKKSEDVYQSNCQRILHAIAMASEEAPTSPMVQLKLSGLLSARLLLKLGEMYEERDRPLHMLEAIAKGLEGKTVSSPLEGALDKTDTDALNSAIDRFRRICEEASMRKVKVLVDAECTYLNPGLDALTLGAVAAFNARSPVVWNTYQCYLKEAPRKLQEELRLIVEDLGCHFGAKVVRGAYMVQEKRWAIETGNPDPVCDGYEATSNNYNNVLSYLLEKVSQLHSKCQFIVATHNEESILYTIERMAELKIDNLDGVVSFGQLYGMCDQVSNTLAREKFAIYKSIPYGTLQEVLPYLARRAVENRSVLERARKERALLTKELGRRIGRAFRK